MKAMSYYTGGKVWITDKIFVRVSIVTEEEDIRMGDAVIARVELEMVHADEEQLRQIQLNNVPLNEITREKAGEMFPDFEGDENMWFQMGKEYDYTLLFSSQVGLTKFSFEKEYDVDWLGKNK